MGEKFTSNCKAASWESRGQILKTEGEMGSGSIAKHFKDSPIHNWPRAACSLGTWKPSAASQPPPKKKKKRIILKAPWERLGRDFKSDAQTNCEASWKGS